MKKGLLCLVIFVNIVLSQTPKTIIISTSPWETRSFFDNVVVYKSLTTPVLASSSTISPINFSNSSVSNVDGISANFFIPRLNYISLSNIIGTATIGNNSIRIGLNNTITSGGMSDNILIGNNSEAGYGSIILGNNSYGQIESVVLGRGYANSGSIVLSSSVDISTATFSSITIGRNSWGSNSSRIIGNNNYCNFSGIAIGDNNRSENGSIVLGYSSKGNLASIAIGIGNESIGNKSFVLGYMSKATAENSGVIGNYTVNNETNTIKIQDDVRLDVSRIKVSTITFASGAILYSTSTTIVLGSEQSSLRYGCVAVGYNAMSDGDFSIAIGNNARTNNGRCVAIGYNCVNNTYGTVKFAVYDTNRNQGAIEFGRSNSDNTTYITLTSANGTVYYLYVNNTGSLVISTTRP